MNGSKKITQALELSKGDALPFGVFISPKGVNFSIFTNSQKPLYLNLYDVKHHKLIQKIEIPFNTGEVKHIEIENLHLPILYNYQLEDGSPFLDPYAKKIINSFGVIENKVPFDWEGDTPLEKPFEELIIYEVHVKGFTASPDSKTKHPGTFLSLIEKIPYLKTLGINSVELMPIHAFDPNEYDPIDPKFKGKLKQYWGYSTLNFFSLAPHFASDPFKVDVEFKQLVKELHRAGIEVILDVVFNHTKGFGIDSNTICYNELAPNVYYEKDGEGNLINASGCGNTFNTNHPVVQELILDSLRYFVEEYHIDGFRFDLASIFYRGYGGDVLPSPPILEAIVKDPILSKTKLISESWDAAGLYQVGNFYPESRRFSEWNGKFRDTIRMFIKGDKGVKGEFATRLLGSKDLFSSYDRGPFHSINFITSHDGFSLKDLVSYNEKHNLENGEENRDGNSHNISWNLGVEGETNDPKILALREQQMKNFHLALFISLGVPMITMGDEYGHTKNGNNNTWCQDNPLSWFSWNTFYKNHTLFDFNKKLIHLRKETPILQRKNFLNDDEIEWHGKVPFQPNFEEDDSFLALRLIDKKSSQELYIAFNSSSENVFVELPPPLFGKEWQVKISTANPPSVIKEGKCEMVPYSSFIAIKG